MERGVDGVVLDKRRNEVNFILEPVAQRMKFLTPNSISLMALVLAFLSGLMLYLSYDFYWLLIPAAIVVLVSGFFDALDGKVARIRGEESTRGDFLDHVFDRYADIFMIGGVAVSGWCNPYVGMMALIGVLLTSYMGTQAQAIGAGRLYAGLLGRADRVVLLTLAPIHQAILMMLGYGTLDVFGYPLSVIEVFMWWFAIIGNLTAVQRAWGIWRSFD